MKVDFLQGKRVVETLFVLVHQQLVVSRPILDNSFKFQTGARGCLLYSNYFFSKATEEIREKTQLFSFPLGKDCCFCVLSDVKLERKAPQEMANERETQQPFICHTKKKTTYILPISSVFSSF